MDQRETLMNETRTYQITSFLYALAALVSAYLIYDHYQVMNGAHFQSLCNIGGIFNCETVTASSYSVIFGIPLATWGLSYYFTVFIVSVIASKSVSAAKEALVFLLPTALISLLASFVLLGISAQLIKALCIFCIVLYVINAVVFVLLFLLLRSKKFSFRSIFSNYDKIRLSWFMGVGLLVFFTFAGTTSNLKDEELPLDVDNFIGRFTDAKLVEVETAASPVVGSSQALIKLVEFSDFECPFCARQAREVKKILLSYGTQVQFIFKNYPLDMSCNDMMKMPMHANACLAARAAWCSYEQNKFGVFHEALFANQSNLSLDNILQIAHSEKLDTQKLEACINSDEARNAVLADINQGHALGIKGTPTFFINGKRIEGLVTTGAIGRLIKELGTAP